MSCGLSHVVALTNPVTTSLVALALLPGLVAMSMQPASCEPAYAAALAVATNQAAALIAALALQPEFVATNTRPALCELALAAALAVETTQVAAFVTSHVA